MTDEVEVEKIMVNRTLKYISSSGAMDMLVYVDGSMRQGKHARFSDMMHELRMNPNSLTGVLKTGVFLGIIEQYSSLSTVPARREPLTASEQGRCSLIPQHCRAYRMTGKGRKIFEHAINIVMCDRDGQA
jgi:hypothetical protein